MMLSCAEISISLVTAVLLPIHLHKIRSNLYETKNSVALSNEKDMKPTVDTFGVLQLPTELTAQGIQQCQV